MVDCRCYGQYIEDFPYAQTDQWLCSSWLSVLMWCLSHFKLFHIDSRTPSFKLQSNQISVGDVSSSPRYNQLKESTSPGSSYQATRSLTPPGPLHPSLTSSTKGLYEWERFKLNSTQEINRSTLGVYYSYTLDADLNRSWNQSTQKRPLALVWVFNFNTSISEENSEFMFRSSIMTSNSRIDNELGSIFEIHPPINKNFRPNLPNELLVEIFKFSKPAPIVIPWPRGDTTLP